MWLVFLAFRELWMNDLKPEGRQLVCVCFLSDISCGQGLAVCNTQGCAPSCWAQQAVPG